MLPPRCSQALLPPQGLPQGFLLLPASSGTSSSEAFFLPLCGRLSLGWGLPPVFYLYRVPVTGLIRTLYCCLPTRMHSSLATSCSSLCSRVSFSTFQSFPTCFLFFPAMESKPGPLHPWISDVGVCIPTVKPSTRKRPPVNTCFWSSARTMSHHCLQRLAVLSCRLLQLLRHARRHDSIF